MSEMINLQEISKLIGCFKENSGREVNLNSNISNTNSSGLSGFKIVAGFVVLGIIGYEIYQRFFKTPNDENG
jgi:hypothetical protein